MYHAIGVVFLFTFLFYAFNPGSAAPTFGDIFEFGYNITIRPIEVLASIKDGFSTFLENLVSWFNSLF